jgi:hypothetical protein
VGDAARVARRDGTVQRGTFASDRLTVRASDRKVRSGFRINPMLNKKIERRFRFRIKARRSSLWRGGVRLPRRASPRYNFPRRRRAKCAA